MLDEITLGSITVSAATSVLLTLLVLIYLVKYVFTSAGRLPPGPTTFPLLGNIMEIKDKDLGEYFTECRQKYGNVFSLKIFRTPLIVLNGHDVIYDAFVRNSHLLSERHIIPTLSEFGVHGLIIARGEKWKTNRRFALRTLRDFGMGRNLIQVKIHEELEVFLTEIESYNGKPFDIKVLLNCSISNVIVSILCGKRYSYDNRPFLDHLKRLQEVFAFTNLFFLPWFCKYVPGDPFGARKVLNVIKECRKFYFNIIDEHIESYDENVTRDLMDAFIKHTRSQVPKGTDVQLDREELLSIVSDLFSAGSETSVTALKWGLIYLLRDREWQTVLYEELKKNVSHNRLPGVEDKTGLPLVEATVLEILRLGNVVPLGVPHAAIRDCRFRGFTIPKEAIILPNLQSVLYDKDVWEAPELFQPTRFLTNERKLYQSKKFIPFSTGRRSCIGESLARMEIFLFLSALVQRFEFLPPEGEEPPTLDAVLGITRAPKPFMMRAIKRV